MSWKLPWNKLKTDKIPADAIHEAMAETDEEITEYEDFEFEDDIGEEEIMPNQPAYTPAVIDTAKKREFIVGYCTNNKTGEYTSFFVTDCFDDAELRRGTRPEVASFPVSQLYDAHEQKQRAEKYRDYMNRINEAKQKAYEQTLLMDIMKEQV